MPSSKYQKPYITQHAPPPSFPPRPLRPSLKITLPSSENTHLQPSTNPTDISALVTAALRHRSTPKRNQSDFFFCTTTSNPVAPPPTPTDEKTMEDMLTPTSGTEGSVTTPSGSDMSRRRVMFADWAEDEDGRRTSVETERSSGETRRNCGERWR